jgi:uncharacterized membrane protein YfcA
MDLLAQALATDGLLWLVLAALLAGVVRGFAGFGTAMIFLPVAGQVLTPFEALAALMIMDFFGPFPHVPRAIRDGHPGDVGRLALGLFVGFPVGVFLLSFAEPEIFRYTVSVVALLLLAALVSGFRYHGRVTQPVVYGVGLSGGLLGGVSGIPGPPVILFYMASSHPPAVIRANNMLYLILSQLALFFALSVQGLLEPRALVIGALLVLPYLLANLAGAAIFRPEAERTYRIVAYIIIGVSAVRGLPVWG